MLRGSGGIRRDARRGRRRTARIGRTRATVISGRSRRGRIMLGRSGDSRRERRGGRRRGGRRGGSRGTIGTTISPLIRRCLSLGGGRPSTVLLFHYNSFCRACGSSTIGTSGVLNVALAGDGKHGSSRNGPLTVTKFPCRTLSACLPGLVHTNRQITVYSRLRVPGRAASSGHKVARVISPKGRAKGRVTRRDRRARRRADLEE